MHNHPGEHWQRNHGLLTLNLESLIADFRKAVDGLGGYLRSTPELRELARVELEGRRVRLVPVTAVMPVSPSVSGSSATASSA